MTTARILAHHCNLGLSVAEGLIDIDYGAYQGLSLKEVETQDPELFQLWHESPPQVRFPGGETLEEVRSRAVASVEDLVSRYLQETIALVSHKVVCKVLMGGFLGLQLSQFWQVEQQTCCVNQIEVAPSTTVVSLMNDTCHLQSLS